MAKSKSFFGLRRGSTKSHTYQVFRGLQVTKDRVYDVKNPQSTAQMEQRLKLPMVANYVASLKDILNHSFEGVEYGEESLKYARQINLRKGALSVVSYVPKGMMNAGIADFRVASGTLPNAGKDDGIFYNASNNTAERCYKFTSAGTIAANAFSNDVSPAMRNIKAKDLALIAPVFFGPETTYDQLTIILCHAGNDYQWKDGNGDNCLEQYNRYYIARLVFDTDRFSENEGWQIGLVEIGDMWIILRNGPLCIKIGSLGNGTQPISQAGDSVEVIYVNGNEYGSDEDILMAASIVSSKVGDVWKRSNAWFQCNTQLESITYNGVIDTYLNSSSTAESTKYLNAGASSVDIPGGDTAA